jgi:hypothetical protein
MTDVLNIAGRKRQNAFLAVSTRLLPTSIKFDAKSLEQVGVARSLCGLLHKFMEKTRSSGFLVEVPRVSQYTPGPSIGAVIKHESNL